MKKRVEQCIRIFRRDEDGNIWEDGEDNAPDDFGGTVPRIVDAIVSPSPKNIKEDHRLWCNRRIDIVEAVYFRPDKRHPAVDLVWTCLAVRGRDMTEQEQGLL